MLTTFFGRSKKVVRKKPAPELRSLIICNAQPEQNNSLRSNRFCFDVVSHTMITHYAMGDKNIKKEPPITEWAINVLLYDGTSSTVWASVRSEFARPMYSNYNLLANVVPGGSFFGYFLVGTRKYHNNPIICFNAKNV